MLRKYSFLIYLNLCILRLYVFNFRWKSNGEVTVNSPTAKNCNGYKIMENGHMVFVVEVLVETRYSVLTVRHG